MSEFPELSRELRRVPKRLKIYLVKNNWLTLKDLTNVSAKALVRLPGIGTGTVYALRRLMMDHGLNLKD